MVFSFDKGEFVKATEGAVRDGVGVPRILHVESAHGVTIFEEESND